MYKKCYSKMYRVIHFSQRFLNLSKAAIKVFCALHWNTLFLLICSVKTTPQYFCVLQIRKCCLERNRASLKVAFQSEYCVIWYTIISLSSKHLHVNQPGTETFKFRNCETLSSSFCGSYFSTCLPENKRININCSKS